MWSRCYIRLKNTVLLQLEKLLFGNIRLKNNTLPCPKVLAYFFDRRASQHGDPGNNDGGSRFLRVMTNR